MKDTNTAPAIGDIVPMQVKVRKKNYVNNRDFFNALVDYYKVLETNPEAPIPSYIGECLSMMANKYSTKPSFSGYSFRDEMIGDALENCFKYLNKFNPEKGENPFAYFTMTIHNAFIRRIKEEERERYVKIKNMRRTMSEDEIASFYGGGKSYDTNEITSEFVRKFEEKNLTSSKKNSKIASANVGLDAFINLDTERDNE